MNYLISIYQPDEALIELPDERLQLTDWYLYGNCLISYDMKGAVETLLGRVGITDGFSYEPKAEVPYFTSWASS